MAEVIARIWHPFTQMANAEPPLQVSSGQGAYLYLADGKRLIDCISSWWVNIHGHAHPQIAEAIYEQARKLEQVIFAGFTHEPAEQLASLLVTRLPQGLSHVFFSDNGSTSVEVSLKMAYQYWQNLGQERKRFIAFQGGYHGDTVGAMSMGRGSPFWERFENLLFAVDLVPFPATWQNDEDVVQKEEEALAALLELLDKTSSGINEDYAALCMEPLVQGAAGMRVCRTEFLRKVAEICRARNILLIFDEVMTGFGRTGDWFASVKAGVNPDIICLSKGISGGFLPLSTTVCNERVFASFLDHTNAKTFYHGHSYTANPLACAAAVASWHLLLQNQDQFKNMEARLRRFFQEELQGNKWIKHERFCGTIFAFETKTAEQDSYFNSIASAMKKRFIEEGVLIRPLGNTIYLMPPYCVSDEDLRFSYRAIAKTLASTCE